MVRAKATPAPAEDIASVDLRSTAKALPLPAGLFLFRVTGASPIKVEKAGNLHFPALHVGPGPGSRPGLVEFIGMPSSIGTWLFHPTDTLVVKVEEPGATLILTSVRAEGTQPLDIDVSRLDGRTPAASTPHVPALAGGNLPAGLNHEPVGESLKVQLSLHIRNRGDVSYSAPNWAGSLAENLWIEAMSIVPQESLGGADIEYKGLSANGFETPWLSNGASCGTKGISLPLVGFAIRLKPEAAAQYDCEYSGYFQSGTTVGPQKNGVPCRSKTAGDPLVGVKLRLVKRAGKASITAPASKAQGPKFSKFREAIKATTSGKKAPERHK